jgi:hypothetical protein
VLPPPTSTKQVGPHRFYQNDVKSVDVIITLLFLLTISIMMSATILDDINHFLPVLLIADVAAL